MMREALPPSPLINVFLAEATRVNCQLMEQALRRQRSYFSVVAYACPAKEVLEHLKDQQPDVGVISTNLPDGPLTGFSVLREMHVLYANTPVVMLVDAPTRELVLDVFRYGAHGLFRRDAPFSALCKCIRAVHEGQIWANSEELHFLREAFCEAVPPRMVNAKGAQLLSQREEMISLLVADGLTNHEIATNLHLSEHTVRNYLFRVFNKLGVSSRVELTLYVLSHRRTGPREGPLIAEA
jgi:DNA-binding NarL/FixJ family response regulator